MSTVCDVDAVRRYYDQVAHYYEKMRYGQTESGYASDHHRLGIVGEILRDRKNLRILDVGCGPGVMMERLIQHRHEVVGIDVSPMMVHECQERLRRLGYGGEQAIVGLAEDLSAFAPDSFDVVLALEVLNHLDDEREDRCYREIARVLGAGGTFIAAYRNKLCDLYSLDRATIEFIQAELLSGMFEDEDEKQVVMTALKGLIQCPDLPPQATGGVGEALSTGQGGTATLVRSDIFDKCHNPLTIEERLAIVGLAVKERYFNRFRPLPPLLRNMFPKVFESQRERLEASCVRDWRGWIMAEIFMVECKSQKRVSR